MSTVWFLKQRDAHTALLCVIVWVSSALLLPSRSSRARRCATPSLGVSRQEHWSGLPFPSPVHKSEKWKWSRSVVSDSLRPWTAAHQVLVHGIFQARALEWVPSPSPVSFVEGDKKQRCVIWANSCRPRVSRLFKKGQMVVIWGLQAVLSLRRVCRGEPLHSARAPPSSRPPSVSKRAVALKPARCVSGMPQWGWAWGEAGGWQDAQRGLPDPPVLSSQDDYMEALARLHLTVTRAYKVNTDINFEVFIHKVDGLSDDHKIETQRDIHQRANDDLADAGLEKIHLRWEEKRLGVTGVPQSSWAAGTDSHWPVYPVLCCRHQDSIWEKWALRVLTPIFQKSVGVISLFFWPKIKAKPSSYENHRRENPYTASRKLIDAEVYYYR